MVLLPVLHERVVVALAQLMLTPKKTTAVSLVRSSRLLTRRARNGGAFAFVGVPGAEQDLAEDLSQPLRAATAERRYSRNSASPAYALEDVIEDAAQVERVFGAFHEAADGAGAVGCSVLGEGRPRPRRDTAGQVERTRRRNVASSTGGAGVTLALPVLLHQGVDPGSEGPGRRFRLPIRSLRARGPRRESAAGQYARRQGNAEKRDRGRIRSGDFTGRPVLLMAGFP